jgi:hypothetical protein
MFSRIALIVTGLAVGFWESVDIFWIDVPAVAAVFAALFLGCTSGSGAVTASGRPVALLVLVRVRGAAAALSAQAHVMTLTKVAAFTLALPPWPARSPFWSPGGVRSVRPLLALPKSVDD